MKRYHLKQSDAPPQVRQALPLIPKTPLLHNSDLEKSFLHVLLVTLNLPERVPIVVWFVVIGLMDYGLAKWIGVGNALVLAFAHAGDVALIVGLARRRISFGPLAAQWLALALLRTISALLCILWPAPTIAQINALHLLLQTVGSALVFHGYHREPAAIGLSRIEIVRTAGGGAGMRLGEMRPNALRLLHIADVHLERHGRRETQLLTLAQQLQPDALLFTGDFLNLSYVRDATAQQQARALWQQLSAIAPTFIVTGSPPVDPHAVVAQIVEGLPIHWLRADAHDIALRGQPIRLIGTTCTHDASRDGEALRRVVQALPCVRAETDTPAGAERPFTILLHHSPDLAPQAAATGAIDLHLAGHTHGGQIRLPGFGALATASHYGKALEMGLYQLDEMLLFVSRGIGLEGMGAPRVRVNCRPELTLIELRAE